MLIDKIIWYVNDIESKGGLKLTFSEELGQINSLFIDTAPVFYYIEAHPQFGPLAKGAVNAS